MFYIPTELFFSNFKKDSIGILTYCSISDFITLKSVSKYFNNQIYHSIKNGILLDFYYIIYMEKYFNKRKNKKSEKIKLIF